MNPKQITITEISNSKLPIIVFNIEIWNLSNICLLELVVWLFDYIFKIKN